jgi:hypothetical protein
MDLEEEEEEEKCDGEGDFGVFETRVERPACTFLWQNLSEEASNCQLVTCL